jgi:gamma-glutamyltranspeptidase
MRPMTTTFPLLVDYSSHGMVSAAQSLATWAGVQIPEAGGIAADALWSLMA